jgi:hypothetical protein
VDLMILPAIGLLLASAASSRYWADRRALVAGLVVACAGVLGAALSLPDISLHIPFSLLLTLGVVTIAVAVASAIYAETRLKRTSGLARN